MTKAILDRLDRNIYDALTTDSRPVYALMLIINHYPDRIEDILYRILRIHREIVRGGGRMTSLAKPAVRREFHYLIKERLSCQSQF